MAKISFDEAQASSSQNQNGVGFFTLVDDGDEAIVRILHDSTDDFDIVVAHDVKVGERQRKVDCLRTMRDPLDRCPFCSAGFKTTQRFFIHLLQYEKDPSTGEIVVLPKIWERSVQYATTIKNLIQEYGPLSDCIFKIRRNGAKGDMHTTYSIMFGNPSIYKEEFYPKDLSGFENYSVIGSVVLSKSVDEMKYYILNGSFDNNTSTADNQTNNSRQVDNSPPWQPPANQVQRPQRFY